jgi:hypothetical protein
MNNDANFHDAGATVTHQLLDVVFSSDDPANQAAFTVTLGAAELDGVTHIELRLPRGCDNQSILLGYWEGVTSQTGPPSEWGASVVRLPEMMAAVVRLVMSA